MATTNRFQTRVLIPTQTNSLTETDLRLDALLQQAQLASQTLNQIEILEEKSNQLRIDQIEQWSENLLENLEQIYENCSVDFQQSLEQLKLFQQMMMNLLNSSEENHLDGKKLSVIEQEICILRCLTYQLDTNKVKIDGKLKLKKTSTNHQYEIEIEDQFDQNNLVKINENKDFISRILVHQDSVESIGNLNLFQQFGQITNNEINPTTPERVLTITGKNNFPQEKFSFIYVLIFRSETFGCYRRNSKEFLFIITKSM